MIYYRGKHRTTLLLNQIHYLETEIQAMEPSLQRGDLCEELKHIYYILQYEREEPSPIKPKRQRKIRTMTTPQDQTKSSRLSRNSFFHIASWLTRHSAEVTPGKTAQELVDVLNNIDELSSYIPQGGIGMHTAPALIRATGYVGAIVGQKGKKAKTKIGIVKFNQLKREVGKMKDSIKNLKESLSRLITTVQEDRDLDPLGLNKARGQLKNLDTQADDEEEITLPETIEEATKMRKEHKQARKDLGLPELEDIPWDEDKHARDDNDAQLDDVYPEDAPHYTETREIGEGISLGCNPTKHEMNEDELIMLRLCLNEDDWGQACDKIKTARNGEYPDNWYDVVIQSGLIDEVFSQWGGKPGLELTDLNTGEVIKLDEQAADTAPADFGTISTEGKEPGDADALDLFKQSTGFEPSPEIQAMIERGNEEARKLRQDQDEEDETANLPE